MSPPIETTATSRPELIHPRYLYRWKESREQYDDRVVEVVWDTRRQSWKMLRFRDDKHEGNYKTVVHSIIRSIEHGVEAEEVCGARVRPV